MPTVYWSLTYFYILKSEEPPVCIPCNEVLTVNYIFAIFLRLAYEEEENHHHHHYYYYRHHHHHHYYCCWYFGGGGGGRRRRSRSSASTLGITVLMSFFVCLTVNPVH